MNEMKFNISIASTFNRESENPNEIQKSGISNQSQHLENH